MVDKIQAFEATIQDLKKKHKEDTALLEIEGRKIKDYEN